MKIAVISDTHDNIRNLERVLKQIEEKVKIVIHCGDYCAPFISAMLAKLGLPIYGCLGNVDGDQKGLAELGGTNFNLVPLYGEFGQVELDKRKIAYCHYPKLANLLAKSGEFDAVFYGHTHSSENKRVNKTLLLNPGAVCGITAGVILGFDKKHKPASYTIYDTQTNSAEIIEIT